MANGKRFICLWLAFFGVFALAEDAKKPADPAQADRERRAREIVSGPVQAGSPVSCESQVKVSAASAKLGSYSQSIARHFIQLPPQARKIAVDAVMFGPPETLAILLEVTRGVLDENGRRLHGPLEPGDIFMLFHMIEDLGPGILTPLYYSLAVDRNPEFLLKKLVDRYSKDVEHRLRKFTPRVQEVLRGYMKQFAHVEGEDARLILAHAVLENPPENLSIMLELTRGVLGEGGKTFVKKPLKINEVMEIIGSLLPRLGNVSMSEVYNSRNVGRDPIQFYQTLVELVELKEKSNTDDMIAMSPEKIYKNLNEFSPRQQELLRGYMAQLGHVESEKSKFILAQTILDNPQENLSIILDLTRGVLGDDGKTVVKKPLKINEVMEIVEVFIMQFGRFALPAIYNSRVVDRDPILLYQTLAELTAKLRAGRLGPRDIETIASPTFH